MADEQTRADAPPVKQVGVNAPLGGARGRKTFDTSDQLFGNAPLVIAPPTQAEGYWAVERLDRFALETMAPERLMSLLVDVSPDLSRGLWDFQRLFNPAWHFVATRPGADEPDEAAEALIDAFFDRLTDLYGSVNVVFNRLASAAYLRGAFVAELVLAADGRTAIDLATPDPASIRFVREWEETRGQYWLLAQYQRGELVRLDYPTVKYVPVDPLPGSPYGRAMVSPAAFTTLFLIGLLHDLRRVVAQQGYPRHDIAIELEPLVSQMDPGLRLDPEQVRRWVEATIVDVQDVYARLQPDQAFVHTSAVAVNRPVGTVDASSLGGIGPVIDMLERQAVKALKTVPLLMGLAQSTTETQANRQWEILAQSIRAVQELCQTMIERLLETMLQAEGVQAQVEFAFDELRSAEALRDQQVLQLRYANAAYAYDRGWYSQKQASEEAVGQEPDAPTPRLTDQFKEVLDPLNNTAPPDAADVQPEPGSTKAAPNGVRVEPSLAQKATYEVLWNQTMPGKYSGLLSAAVARNGGGVGPAGH